MVIYTFKVPESKSNNKELILNEGLIISPEHEHETDDFIKCLNDVCEHKPETWKSYGDSLSEWFRILNMEFIEVNTDLQNKKYNECKMNLCHFACACKCMFYKIHEMTQKV